MTYKWKVGDKGLTRSGKPYEVVAVGMPVDGPYTMAVIVGRRLTVYTPSGSLCSNKKHDLDLMPPERKVRHCVRCNEHGVFYANSDDTPVEWTIGSDGQPAYAVRLDDKGRPMYRVEFVPEDQR